MVAEILVGVVELGKTVVDRLDDSFAGVPVDPEDVIIVNRYGLFSLRFYTITVGSLYYSHQSLEHRIIAHPLRRSRDLNGHNNVVRPPGSGCRRVQYRMSRGEDPASRETCGWMKPVGS